MYEKKNKMIYERNISQMPQLPSAPAGEQVTSGGQGLCQSSLYDQNYTQGFLRTQIGRRVKIEFLIGTNMLVDREGTLISVGISYIIIQETDTDDYLLCDMYSIKFIKFYY